jgi:hypothetical protein
MHNAGLVALLQRTSELRNELRGILLAVVSTADHAVKQLQGVQTWEGIPIQQVTDGKGSNHARHWQARGSSGEKQAQHAYSREAPCGSHVRARSSVSTHLAACAQLRNYRQARQTGGCGDVLVRSDEAQNVGV